MLWRELRVLRSDCCNVALEFESLGIEAALGVSQ